MYLKTFEDVLLFPLAIENNSSELDEDLEVTVEVYGNCEPIIPSVEFINPMLREVASVIYQDGFPRDLFYLQDDIDIKYDNNKLLNYDQERPFYSSAVLQGFPVNIENKEYEYAMKRYIATPDSDNRYSFSIDNLRATEKKWLGKIIALRLPKHEKPSVKMRYRIISNNTSGDLEGELEYMRIIR
ncbi:hypothetical protein SAMN02745229_03794 [Butyrivibrio fibrisolvens DSM 3071]|uniref:Uncharacterized protein n=1 Tax=Butyrivibrio fibrisolvens DSM 3071 TaxID=1121131 RepID=A0A1M6EU22_BUTFI|nr:hypothetical protein [Butyrivibrio fibrisolvens]SHI89024.1 hypothetical protein SAMN02745229_03794 [Butyrivibrio fibrisolvens DSM 3071]